MKNIKRKSALKTKAKGKPLASTF